MGTRAWAWSRLQPTGCARSPPDSLCEQPADNTCSGQPTCGVFTHVMPTHPTAPGPAPLPPSEATARMKVVITAASRWRIPSATSRRPMPGSGRQAAHRGTPPGAAPALGPAPKRMSHGSSPVQRLYRGAPKEGAGLELLGRALWAGGALQSAPCGRGGSGVVGRGFAGGALPARALVASPGTSGRVAGPCLVLRRNSSGRPAPS